MDNRMDSDNLQEFFDKISPVAHRERLSQNSVNPGFAGGIPSGAEAMNFSGEYSGWGQLKDDSYISVSISCDQLPSGFYRPVITNSGIVIQKVELYNDKLLKLPDSRGGRVVEEISKFRTLGKNFKERGLLHKRGVLLWGAPGSGKTCTVHQILEILITEHKGVAIQVDHPQLAAQALQMIRRVEPERQIVAVMEDIDAMVDRYGEAEYLALLDGESQVDNIVYLATTNYPERLDKRFVDRPSRFDSIVWVGMPTANDRRCYLEAKEKNWDEEELEYLVGNSEGFSIAHLRELLILIKCLGYSATESIERLSNMRVKPPNSGDAPDRKKAGFAP